MIIANKHFDTANNYYIMGILNVTPDSFSDGGKYNEIDKALLRVEEMIKEGADIIDVGGESTHPSRAKISDSEETGRILPFLSAIKERFDIPVSLDTYKSSVAKEAAPYIDMVNDIWGLKYSEDMASLIAKHKLSCCIMHNRDNRDYSNFIDDVIADLKESLKIAEKAGIEKNRIMLDGGVGFAKSFDYNLLTVKHTDKLASLGYPLLMGTSRKGFIGKITDTVDGDRLQGTIATTVYGAMNGASFFRVHDIKENRQALQMLKAILEVQNG